MGEPTFWKTFAKLLPFTLLAGSLGPIFLVAYVVVDDAPVWLVWAGIVIIIAVVAVTVLAARTITENSLAYAAQRAHGVPAIGRIVGSRDTGPKRGGRRQITVDLEVAGPRVEPFTARVATVVPANALGAVTSGLLGVFVGDDREVTVDWKATALYTGQLPARFASDARDQTYDLTGEADPLLRIVDVLRRHGIPLGATLDVRDDPAVRAEIREIVDEFADRHDAASSRERTVSRRLADLDDLLKYGQITRSEYETLRARVLQSI